MTSKSLKINQKMYKILGHYELVLFVPSKIHEKIAGFPWKNSRKWCKDTKVANINQQNQWKILGHYESTSTYFSKSNKKPLFYIK
jgi:hypothetical protein